MDRYIVRESRAVYPAPGGQQMPPFPQHLPQNPPIGYVIEGNFSRETPTHYQGNVMSPYILHNSPSFPPSGMHGNLQHQTRVVSGIDPTYLSGFAGNATYITTGDPLNNTMQYINHGYQGYQNQDRNDMGSQRNFHQQRTKDLRQGFSNKTSSNAIQNTIQNNDTYIHSNPQMPTRISRLEQNTWGAKGNTPVPAEEKKTFLKENASEKIDKDSNFISRAEKLKGTIPKGKTGPYYFAVRSCVTGHYNICDRAVSHESLVARHLRFSQAIQKSGSRTFSGPVEKVLKWHKSLQDLGVLVFYEIVAKCVSLRQGDTCSKHLVIRDDNGPAMQVVYYEVDFMLPEIKPPIVVRIIGKMMSGTSRFQAFNVRMATGDDVAMLPRRAAVSAHHVAKICKEFQSVV